MVKAMAPKAPIGATRTMMRMMPKNIFAALSMASAIGSPALPRKAMAKPERIEINSTCSRSPRAIAPRSCRE